MHILIYKFTRTMFERASSCGKQIKAKQVKDFLQGLYTGYLHCNFATIYFNYCRDDIIVTNIHFKIVVSIKISLQGHSLIFVL